MTQKHPTITTTVLESKDTGLGFCKDGLYLQGRAPGCRLRRELSSDTLSHILHEDNLLFLGIPLAAHRPSQHFPQHKEEALSKKLNDLSMLLAKVWRKSSCGWLTGLAIPASAPATVRYKPAKRYGFLTSGGGSAKF